MKYFIAVAFVWFGCALAWITLGSTLVYRSGEMSSELTQEVDKLWGPPLVQRSPSSAYTEIVKVKEKVRTTDTQGKTSESEIEKDVAQTFSLPLARSNVAVGLELEHRRKGLLWFPTYVVDFDGEFEFLNDTSAARDVDLTFPLATENAVYDGFSVSDPENEPVPFTIAPGGANWKKTLAPGERTVFRVHYRSRGRSEWRYQLTQGTGKVERFSLTATSNFGDANFPAGTLSPSQHARTDEGWRGQWKFESLISSSAIGIELPQKLNPGPLASRITFFAPVGLLFFFFVAAVVWSTRASPLHPMHYFFLGCAFFAFHLLFAYLVDHVRVETAFVASSLVSVFLVVTYARLYVGWRAAFTTLGFPQLLYLVLFSYTFFWEGYTGLAIAIGAVLTLFVIMQMTGRARWGGSAPATYTAAPPVTSSS